MISVSEKTYKNLAQMGTLEDTFDSVIQRMIDKEKIATSGPKSYQEPGQIAAIAPQPSSAVQGADSNGKS